MARPRSNLDDFLDWQARLESYKASGLDVDSFCLQEGVSRSTFYRWVKDVKNGIPPDMLMEEADRKHVESGEAKFLPVSIKPSPIELQLPNGGVVRLPLSVGQAVLLEVIKTVGALRPGKEPKS